MLCRHGWTARPSVVPALSEVVPVCDVTSGSGIGLTRLIFADVSKLHNDVCLVRAYDCG
jgi:hypothetical protein